MNSIVKHSIKDLPLDIVLLKRMLLRIYLEMGIKNLIIGDRQYHIINGQPQTYSVSGSVKLEFLNVEEMNNFEGTIKFTNVN